MCIYRIYLALEAGFPASGGSYLGSIALRCPHGRLWGPVARIFQFISDSSLALKYVLFPWQESLVAHRRLLPFPFQKTYVFRARLEPGQLQFAVLRSALLQA